MTALCIGCGCDEAHGCPAEHGPEILTCFWLYFDSRANVGLCSCCEDLVTAWRVDGQRKPFLTLIAERFYRQVMFLYEEKVSALSWMHAPHPLLGGRSARDCILAGELDKVQTIVDQIRSGACS